MEASHKVLQVYNISILLFLLLCFIWTGMCEIMPHDDTFIHNFPVLVSKTSPVCALANNYLLILNRKYFGQYLMCIKIIIIIIKSQFSQPTVRYISNCYSFFIYLLIFLNNGNWAAVPRMIHQPNKLWSNLDPWMVLQLFSWVNL